MYLVLDVSTGYECTTCGGDALAGRDVCTSCRRWDTDGVLPTTLPSVHAAIDALADLVDDTDGDRTLHALSDRLVHLERTARPTAWMWTARG